MPLQAFFLDWLQLDGVNGRWVAFVCTYLNACFLWMLNVRHIFLKANEHLLPLCYIVFASAVPETQLVFGAQLAAALLLLGTHYIFSVYQQKRGIGAIFIAAFCFSLASLFFSSSLALLVLLPIAVLIIHPFAWRDWIAMLAGVATPCLYVFLYYWLVTGDIQQIVPIINNYHVVEWPLNIGRADAVHFIYLLIFAFLLLVAFFAGFSQGSASKVKVSHCYAIFEWMLLLLIVGSIFYPGNKYLSLPLIAVPAAVLVTAYSVAPNNRKAKSRTVLFLLYVAAALLVQLL